MLGSISAVVFFGLSIGLANFANEIAKLGVQHPIIMSDQATAVSYNNNGYFCMQIPCRGENFFWYRKYNNNDIVATHVYDTNKG